MVVKRMVVRVGERFARVFRSCDIAGLLQRVGPMLDRPWSLVNLTHCVMHNQARDRSNPALSRHQRYLCNSDQSASVIPSCHRHQCACVSTSHSQNGTSVLPANQTSPPGKRLTATSQDLAARIFLVLTRHDPPLHFQIFSQERTLLIFKNT
jgi:hypothetical protein